MTTCCKLIEICQRYRCKEAGGFAEKDDYEGWLEKYEEICGTSPNHAREIWNAVPIHAQIATSLQICSIDVPKKVTMDAYRIFQKKQNLPLMPKVIPRAVSLLRNKGVLTASVATELVRRERGTWKPGPTIKYATCENCFETKRVEETKRKNDHVYCLKCIKEVTMPSKEKVTKKTYESPYLKKTWPERKELIHAPISKMEEWLRDKFSEKGINFITGKAYPAIETWPDFYLPEYNLFLYLDGEKVHRDRVHKDDYLREECEKTNNVKVVGLTYPDNTQKTKGEIWAEVTKMLGYKPERIMEAIEK